jgi:ABC-type branched-subunit amino acid transport system ATPase component
MVKGAGSMESAVTDRAPLLEVESVRKSFGGLDVLQGISLSVYPGEICGLIGPNGCGKSTLFDVITGYQKADSGVVRFAGKSVEKDLPHEVARNGLIRTFQLTRVFPQLTVAENLLVFADVRDEAGDDRARELLDFVHLLALADREASTLSYGQLKLLELAQVLMHRPKMLLLDEPMAGINPGLIEEIVGYLRQLRDEGMTILLVEHNLPVVTDLCDRIAVISAGEVLVNDAPDIVVNNPVVKEVFLGG